MRGVESCYPSTMARPIPTSAPAPPAGRSTASFSPTSTPSWATRSAIGSPSTPTPPSTRESATRARSRHSAPISSGLYLVLERGLDGPAATALKNRVAAADPGFVWLNPPNSNAALNIHDVLTMRGEMRHCEAIEAWARSVWDGWQIHHATVRGWVEGALEQVGQT